MNIVNVGPGTYEENELSAALKRGSERRYNQGVLAANQQSNVLRSQELAQKGKHDAASLRMERSKYQMELAKANKAQENTDWDNGYKLLTDVSAKAISMDDTMRQMWEKTPDYKELTKVLKKRLGPEFVNETGVINYLGKTDMIKDKLESLKFMYADKKQKGIATTPGEDAMAKLIFNVGPEAAAKKIQAIMDDPRFQDAQEIGDTQTMSRIAQQYMNQVFPDEGMSAALAPTEASNSNDPLGLRNA